MYHPPPHTWAELPEQKNNRKRKSDNSGRGGLGEGGLGQQRNMDEARNPDVEPRLRVMERF